MEFTTQIYMELPLIFFNTTEQLQVFDSYHVTALIVHNAVSRDN